MGDELKKFLEMLSQNKELVKKLNDINIKYPDVEDNISALVKLAKEYGIEINPEELLDVSNAKLSDELSDDELEQVSGGRMKSTYGYDNNRNYVPIGECDCFCVAGGGGTGDEYQKSCACVFGGGGSFTAKGKATFAGEAPMICVVAGWGEKFAFKHFDYE